MRLLKPSGQANQMSYPAFSAKSSDGAGPVSLAIYQAKELTARRREVLIRAESSSEAHSHLAEELGLPLQDVGDPERFTVSEVNYGEDFREAGPRGVIAVF